MLLTQIGDKSWFVATLKAMRYNKWAVLLGAIAGQVLMTAINCLIGDILGLIIPLSGVFIISTILFILFGIKIIYETQYEITPKIDHEANTHIELNQYHDGLMEKANKNK